MVVIYTREKVQPRRMETQAEGFDETLPQELPRNVCVLLVDDDARSRTGLSLCLKRRGFDVLEAASGYEAQHIYRRKQESVSVVILGVRMSGLNGAETMVALRKLNPNVCCCFTGAHLGSFTQAALKQMGAAAVFNKPFDLPVLVETLSTLDRARSPLSTPAA